MSSTYEMVHPDDYEDIALYSKKNNTYNTITIEVTEFNNLYGLYFNVHQYLYTKDKKKYTEKVKECFLFLNRFYDGETNATVSLGKHKRGCLPKSKDKTKAKIKAKNKSLR